MTFGGVAEYNNRMEEFNSSLKRIRITRGYTQKQISDALNVSLNCYASWEQGRTEPPISKIKILCEIFGVTSDELLGISDAFDNHILKVAEGRRRSHKNF